MGSNRYEETPSRRQPDVQLSTIPKRKGVIIISDNTFFTRLWFQLSNPFRYIFTGKVRF